MTVEQTGEEKGRILVVDDYAMNRLKLKRVLEQQGHSVGLAEDGRQALAQLEAEPYDVVLLDLMMPEMDGHQVLETMKREKHLRDIPVIVISAVDELDSAVRCIEMGAEDYLPKPFNPVFLKARLSASLRRKRLRDLEKAYLHQEIMLRQSEKLATLGRLSAGMAHELNNPASAVKRGAGQLQHALVRHLEAHLALDRTGLSEEQVLGLQQLDGLARSRAREPEHLDPLTRSDREAELEDWFMDAGVDNGWELAPDLVSMRFTPADAAQLAGDYRGEQLQAVLAWLVSRFTMCSIVAEIDEGAGRMTEIVRALKTYTYLDQAPVQNVNVHAGLDNTLVMLRSKLKRGVTVERDYAEGLPLIEAYGSELNQVWTNIIDNAVAAMDGQGQITLRTRAESAWVVVEIEDNGPGIPEEIQASIFDPFFTTKPPGEGTGLGLNISHNIIVQKHKGTIGVTSAPGHTTFRVALPQKLSEESGQD